MNIFVSNLSHSVSSDDLKALFEPFGEVSSAKVIDDRDTGISKCFGFVEMGNSDGQSAIDSLNATEYKGKSLSVSVARPKPERSSGGFGGGGNRGGGFGGGNRNRY